MCYRVWSINNTSKAIMPIEEKHQLIDDEAVFKYDNSNLESKNCKDWIKSTFRLWTKPITLYQLSGLKVQGNRLYWMPFLEPPSNNSTGVRELVKQLKVFGTLSTLSHLWWSLILRVATPSKERRKEMYYFFYLENREKELSFRTCRFSHTSDQPVDPTNRFVQGIPAFDPWNHFRAEFTSFRFWGAKEYYFRCQGLLPVNREQVSIERKSLQKSGIGLEQHQKASRKGKCPTPGLVQTGCLFLGLQSRRTWTVRKRCRWA